MRKALLEKEECLKKFKSDKEQPRASLSTTVSKTPPGWGVLWGTPVPAIVVAVSHGSIVGSRHRRAILWPPWGAWWTSARPISRRAVAVSGTAVPIGITVRAGEEGLPIPRLGLPSLTCHPLLIGILHVGIVGCRSCINSLKFPS